MTTYNTGNPVPSADARDRYDNSQTFDELINSSEDQAINRIGQPLRTWRGMENAFDLFLANTAFELPPLVYVDGTPLQVDRPTQLIQRGSLLYSVKLPSAFPLVLSGTWATDEPLLTVRADQSLRQDLNNAVSAALGASLVGRAVVAVPSMYALCQLGSYRTDAIYRMASWHVTATPSKLRGCGDFVLLNIPKSLHNGGTIISTTVPITNSFASTPAFLAGTGETDPSGSGCLVRVYTGDIWAEWFGLLDDSSYVWNCKSFNAAIKWADVVSPDISPGMVRFGDGEFRTTDPIILYRQNGVTGRIPGFRGQGAYHSTIIKTTANTTGASYPWLNIDAAVIELPPQDTSQYLAGSDIGGFTVQKLGDPRTGYGFYAARSYFGKRTDMFIRGFNYGFSTPGCWMANLQTVWCFGNNVGFTLSGTSNFGGNLYSAGSYEIGFDLSGLTYSNLTTACDGTGETGTTPKVAYKLSGSHGLKLHAGAEKNVGKDFEIANSMAVTIGGHCFSTGVSTVITNKITVSGSVVRFDYDWSLALSNLTAPQKAFYPNLYPSKDASSAITFGSCNFGETDPRMPQVLDGKFLSDISITPYSNHNGYVIHQLLLSSSVFKQAIYVGSSPRIKFIYGVCTDTTADTSFEPTVPLGHAVSAISTSSATPTDIGNLYIGGVLNAGRLQGYVSNGWLYLRGPAGQQRVHSLHFITAPQP